MLKEAIESLLNRGRNETDVKLIPEACSATHIVYQTGGDVESLDLIPSPRRHTVATVDDMVVAHQKWSDLEGSSVLWADLNTITLVCDDQERLSSVTLPLEWTDQFSFLHGLGEGGKNTFNKPEMIRVLRVALPGVNSREELLTTIRSVNFKRSNASTGDIQHGNESLGASVEMEVTGGGSIPDLLTVGTAVFSNIGEEENRVTIGLDLEIDLANQLFKLTPLPDEIQKARQAAIENIRQRLAEKLGSEATILFGDPVLGSSYYQYAEPEK